MNVEKTALDGVLVVTPKRFGDLRGFFSETWNQSLFAEKGIDVPFVQENHSLSRSAGTIRGLHCQAPPRAQAKLIRVVRGRVVDVAVDVRRGSPSYGKWVSVELSAENGKQLFVPVGFLHGFATLDADTEVLYKCSDFYAPECEASVRFDDQEIGIDWGVEPGKVVLSDKDARAQTFKDFLSPFVFEVTP